MTNVGALLAAMAADPADDTVRLAYADFLEESGHGDRAEFVRVQVDLARCKVGDPANLPLVQRNVRFLRDQVPAWRDELPRLNGIEWGDFNRGLIEEVQAGTVAALIRHAEIIFAEPAIHILRLARLVDAGDLAALPQLARLRELRLIRANASDDSLMELFASPHLRNLIVLDLDANRATEWTAAAIADGRFPALEEVWLGSNRIGNAGAETLAQSKHLEGLRFLDLRDNGIRDLQVRSLLWRRFGNRVKL
jgi:uncharacterized protein (TIGR02996 family)